MMLIDEVVHIELKHIRPVDAPPISSSGQLTEIKIHLQHRFDFAFDAFIQLHAAGIKEFDPIFINRVVRSGYDHASIHTQFIHHKSNARGCDHAQINHGCAAGKQSRGQSALQHFSRLSGVASDRKSRVGCTLRAPPLLHIQTCHKIRGQSGTPTVPLTPSVPKNCRFLWSLPVISDECSVFILMRSTNAVLIDHHLVWTASILVK